MAPPRVGPRPYKDILTPALHRRFTNAASVVLLVCYAEAIIIGENTSVLWFWFPFGSTGIRTLLLFISALAVFILRVAQLHVGVRTTASSFHTFWNYFLRYNTIQTVAWYFFSAWWFSEVYVWSSSKDAELAWISDAKAHERPRLNERPIYLRSVFLILALVQSCVHLYYDYDRLPLPLPTQRVITDKSQAPEPTATPIEKLKLAIPQRAQTALLRSLSMLLAGPIVYSIFLRKHAWSWALWFAKIFWSLPRSASTPPTIPPFHISLLVRSVASSFFLVFLWEASDATFSAFATQEPLKRGRPLTDDSRDPNGSLLIGLRSKKEIPKSFAFWELHYISQHLPDRRKSIFEDIDRKGGATWVQVLSLCLDVVAGLNARIEAAINPPPPAPARPAQMVEQGNPQPLPRLTAPLQEGDIFTPSPPPASRPEMVKSTVSTIAKSYGQSPSSPSLIPRISPRVKRVIEYGVDKTLTPEQKQMLTKEGRASTVSGYLREFLKSVAGRPLRQTLRRRSAAVALGTPYGGMSILIDAVDSLSRLAVLSLSEDPYGKVQADVPVIIRTYVNTAKNLDTLKGALEPHWTDVEGDSDGYRERSFAEVDTVQTAVRGGLAKVLEAFGPYATVMGLGKGEMRLAREAAGLAEERDGEVGRRR